MSGHGFQGDCEASSQLAGGLAGTEPAGWLLLGCVSQSIWQQADSQTRAVWREDRSLWERMQGSRSKVLKARKQLCEGAWTGLRNPSFLAQYCQVPAV